MKKTQVIITLVLVAAIVSASLIATASFAAPTETHGAISITFDDNMQNEYDYAFPSMQARGIVGTFYVVTDHISDFSGDSSYMSIAELQTLQNYGCEIASHTKTHAKLTEISDSQIRDECSISKQVLQSYGFTANNFAYPYGATNDHVDSIVSQYYRSARGTFNDLRIMYFPVSQFSLPGFVGETGDSTVLARLESAVDQVYSSDGWAIFFFHNIIPGDNHDLYTISEEDFSSFLDYVVYKGVPTITVDQGLDLSSPPSPSPSVSISPASVKMYLGQSQTFSSSVSGGNPPYSYQWYLNDIAVSGATSSTWTFTPTLAGNYEVYLLVTDNFDSEAQSNVVDTAVYSQLSVTISPASVNMTVGGSQIFTSTVSGGAPPYSYRWYLNGSQVSGATGPTWTFTPTTAGTYRIYSRVADSYTATAQSNTATAKVETPLIVGISPTSVRMYVGQSQTFSFSVSGGTPPYLYQWYLNDTAVSGATSSTWTFTPRSTGHYKVYLRVTDGLNFKVQSNVVTDVLVCSVHLLLTVEPNQATYVRRQSVTFTVNVFNQLDPAFESTLALTVTGPNNYYDFDFQTINVPAGTVREYSFSWDLPNVAGKYVVEVSLFPSILTAYDTVWLTEVS